VVRARVAGDVAPHPRHRRRRDPAAAVGLVLQRGHYHQRHVVGRLQARHAPRAFEAAEVVVPAVRVPLGRRVEARARGTPRRADRGVARPAESERQRQAPPGAHARQRQQDGLDDVPGLRRRAVAPVHPVVVLQARPSVAGAQVAAGNLARRRPDHQRARVAVVEGDERIAGPLAPVVVAVVGQRRVVERVKLVGPSGERLEDDVDEHGGARRVRHVGLGNPPAPGTRPAHLPVRQAAPIHEPHLVHRVLALALGERPAVGDGELQITDARGPEVGVVDLGQIAVVEREPHLAGERGGGPEAVLVALRPVRDLTRRARRRPVRAPSDLRRASEHGERADDGEDEHAAETASPLMRPGRTLRTAIAGAGSQVE
jgi:hypothetical protein